VRHAGGLSRFGAGLLRRFEDDRWQVVTDPLFTDDTGRIDFRDVAIAGSTVILGGYRYDGSSPVEAILLESSDGDAYTAVQHGIEGSGWQAFDDLCAADDGRVVAFLVRDFEGVESVEGFSRAIDGTWTPLPADTFTAQHQYGVNDCVHAEAGFLAVGWAYEEADNDVMVWSSLDGVAWQAVDGPPEFANDFEQYAVAVDQVGEGYVIVGSDGTDQETRPTVWFGSGSDWQQVRLPAGSEDMGSLDIVTRGDTILVAGWKDDAVRIYRTTLDDLVGATAE
jgi:hypothetical protein